MGFWAQMGKICNQTLKTEEKAIEFKDSHILQAIYHDDKFIITATAIKQLNQFSALEQLILIRERRIDSVALIHDPTPLEKLSPQVTGLFLNDKNIPDSIRTKLEKVAQKYVIIDKFQLSDSDKTLEKPIDTLKQEQIEGLLFNKLDLAQTIDQKFIDRLYELRHENINNLVYIQSLIDIKAAVTNYLPAPDDYELALKNFPQRTVHMLNKLKISLDKPLSFSNNPKRVYEKHLFLTPEGDYGIDNSDWKQWLDTVEKKQFIGLTLLIALSKPSNSEETQDKALEVLDSLHTVGLIEQTQLIARNILGDILRYNKEK